MSLVGVRYDDLVQLSDPAGALRALAAEHSYVMPNHELGVVVQIDNPSGNQAEQRKALKAISVFFQSLLPLSFGTFYGTMKDAREVAGAKKWVKVKDGKFDVE